MQGFKRMFIIFIALLIFIIAFFVYMTPQTPNIYQGARSDHFNGKNFFNPGLDNNKSLFAILRWWMIRDRTKWPEHVPNAPRDPHALTSTPQHVRITFINHATVLIQTPTVTILTDPVWSDRVSPFRFIGPARVREPGIPFNELPRIDVVIISHNHYDHLDLATLQKLDQKFHPIILVPLGNKQFLESNHLTHIVEMDWWQQYQRNAVTITFLPSQHWSSRWLNDRSRTLWGSYGIVTDKEKIYFAGDTGFSAQNFTQTYQRWGTPDIALLPIGSYKPEWFMHDNHMNPEEAIAAHLLLHAKNSIPIHYGTFQLSEEGIDTPLHDLQKALVKHRLAPNTFQPLREGLSRDFP